MKIITSLAAGAAALSALVAVAPASAQRHDRVVVHRTVVRHEHHRRVCTTRYEHHHRVRVCR